MRVSIIFVVGGELNAPLLGELIERRDGLAKVQFSDSTNVGLYLEEFVFPEEHDAPIRELFTKYLHESEQLYRKFLEDQKQWPSIAGTKEN